MDEKQLQALANIATELEAIKKWRIHRSTAESLLDFARRYTAIVRGWIEYCGKFWSRNFNYRLWSAMQSRLLKWMQSKYRLSNRKAQCQIKSRLIHLSILPEWPANRVDELLPWNVVLPSG